MMVLVLCINVIIINLPNTEKSNLSIIYFLFLFYFWGGGGGGDVSRKSRARKAVLCKAVYAGQDQSFNNFENNTMKLTVNEGKLTGL